MKLLFCTHCSDIVALRSTWRKCECGESAGRYLEDNLHAEYAGFSLAIGINNHSILPAIKALATMKNEPKNEESSIRGPRIEAWFFSSKISTRVKKVDMPLEDENDET